MARYAALSSSPLPLSPEDLYEFRFLTDAQMSPDGRWLAFVVRDPKDAEDEEDGVRVYDRARYKSDEGGLLDDRRKHIWIVGVDGAAPRRLTDGDYDDGQPEFSPDGREIAFVSNRTEKRDLN